MQRARRLERIQKYEKDLYGCPVFWETPQSFNFFLLSCAYNPDVDWLLLTDDDRPLPYPENVHCVVMSFDALRARFQTKFSFPLSLERPYKLRDYRPAYGFLLEEELPGAMISGAAATWI